MRRGYVCTTYFFLNRPIMDKEVVPNLLQNIYVNKFVGVSPIDALTFSIEKELIERTEIGNFKLSDKGLSFLKGDIKWESI